MLTIDLLNSCAQFAAFDQADRCTLRAPALYALARMKANAKDLNDFVQTYDAQLQASPAWQAWPAGEAWLSSASAQYRLSFATWLIKQSKLTLLKKLPSDYWIEQSKNWLGIPEWSPRTKAALQTALDDPMKFTLLALCSPEYVVNA